MSDITGLTTNRAVHSDADYRSVVGILGEDENGEMDLGMLERKLVEKHQLSRQASQAVSQPTSPSQATSGQDGTSSSTPRSSLTSPEPSRDKDHDHDKRKSVPPGPPEEKKPEEEVEALSEMMCSLVTNNSGETRYIGTALSKSWSPRLGSLSHTC